MDPRHPALSSESRMLKAQHPPVCRRPSVHHEAVLLFLMLQRQASGCRVNLHAANFLRTAKIALTHLPWQELLSLAS